MQNEKNIQNLTEIFQINFGKVVSLFLIVWLTCAFFIMICIACNLFPRFIIVIWISVPLVLFELIIRFLMYMAYGPYYRYSLFSYLLVDHPLYGTSFRKNCSSKKIDFLLFDKFVFIAGTPRTLNLIENKEKRVNFNINSLGYRGSEFLPNKKQARVRIFCSGGSTTACDCNNDDQTWPAQLQIYFQKNGFDVEVINAGVQGWYSYQELLRFKNEIRQYNADIVLLHQGWNDEFEFSSLSLGNKWKPKIVRNVREQNNLYCPPNRFLSSAVSLSLHMAIHTYLKYRVFVPNMSFDNPERWKVLKRSDYIIAWFDNMVEFADLCFNNNILLYTINYPGMVNLSDTLKERNLYLQNSRLTPLFADYQTISKKRISRTLKETEKIIPCLNVEEDFAKFKGIDRLKLFYDEIHMTPEGNRLLAESICEKLLFDKDFRRKYSDEVMNKNMSNVTLGKENIQRIRKILQCNRPYIDRYIDRKIEKLQHMKYKRGGATLEVPEDRYTTF